MDSIVLSGKADCEFLNAFLEIQPGACHYIKSLTTMFNPKIVFKKLDRSQL
jgi:hypothetical protein